MANELPDDEQLLDVLDVALHHEPKPLADLAVAVMEEFPEFAGLGWGSSEVEDFLTDLMMGYEGYWNRGAEIVASTPMMRQDSFATARLTSAQIEAGGIAVDEVTLLLDLFIPVKTDGTEGYDLDKSDELLTGPSGWLADASAGDIVALSFDGTQLRHDIITNDDLADDTAIVSWLRTESERCAERGRGADDFVLAIECRMSMWHAEHRPFSRAVRPLSELFTAAGFERRDGEWGPAGAEWTTSATASLARSIDQVAEEFGFDPCCDLALEEVMAVLERLADPVLNLAPPSPAELESVADALIHSYVGSAVVSLFCRHRTKAPALSRLGALLRQPDLSRVARAAGAFLAGLDEELHGDGVACEAALQQAVELQPQFLSAKESLAFCAVDRGDVAGAIRLCGDLEPDSDPLAMLLAYREYRERRYRDVKRNDRCPCGSGRRFKQCCQRHPVLSLQDRVDDLNMALVLASERPQRSIDRQMVDILAQNSNMTDYLEPFDALVIEGGLLADYLERRGSLLTDARRELAEQLLANGRSVRRVIEAADSDGQVRVEPLDGGPAFALPLKMPAHPGDFLLGNFCVVDGELGAMGLVSVFDAALEEDLVSGLTEHDKPAQVLQWLDELVARNTLRLPDGEGRVMLLGTIEVPDVAAFESWLGGPAVEGPTAWAVDPGFDHSLASPPVVHRSADGGFAVSLPSASSRERFLEDLRNAGLDDVEIDWSLEIPITLGFLNDRIDGDGATADWDRTDHETDWDDEAGPALRLP